MELVNTDFGWAKTDSTPTTIFAVIHYLHLTGDGCQWHPETVSAEYFDETQSLEGSITLSVGQSEGLAESHVTRKMLCMVYVIHMSTVGSFGPLELWYLYKWPRRTTPLATNFL